jgi:hypothetical protein
LNKGAKINLMEELVGEIMQRRFPGVFVSHMQTSRPNIAA